MSSRVQEPTHPAPATGPRTGTGSTTWADAALARLPVELGRRRKNQEEGTTERFLDHPCLGREIGISAVVVGSTLEAPPSADDKRNFFVIGAGLLAMVLF
jgi:hypothetical protein